MARVIVPTASFRIFDIVVRQAGLPFSASRLFTEFSSLVETLVLSDEVNYFNLGAYNFEWEWGAISRPLEKAEHNPYSAFHNIDFIQQAPFEYFGKTPNLIETAITKEELEITLATEYEGEPFHEFSLHTYLIAYEQTYNGWFGDAAVKEYSLVQNLLPKLFKFHDSPVAVDKDPLVFQAYELLKTQYAKQLVEAVLPSLTPVVIPPITAILLSRLPPNVRDPFVVMHHILELRDDLGRVRSRFNKYQASMYAPDATIKDWQNAKLAVEADAKALSKKFGESFHDRVVIRWFIDNASFLAKMIVKGGIDPDEVAGILARVAPPLVNRLTARAPSLMYDFAMNTRFIPSYSSLIESRLGLLLRK